MSDEEGADFQWGDDGGDDGWGGGDDGGDGGWDGGGTGEPEEITPQTEVENMFYEGESYLKEDP